MGTARKGIHHEECAKNRIFDRFAHAALVARYHDTKRIRMAARRRSASCILTQIVRSLKPAIARRDEEINSLLHR